MGYWMEIKDVVAKGVDLAVAGIKDSAKSVRENAVTGIKDTANFALEKGREGLLLAQLKRDLMVKHAKLQSLLADLGDLTHDLFKQQKDIYCDPEINATMAKVVQIENECKDIESKIRGVGVTQL